MDPPPPPPPPSLGPIKLLPRELYPKGPKPREPMPIGPQPRELQPIDISLYKSLAIVLFKIVSNRQKKFMKIIMITYRG